MTRDPRHDLEPHDADELAPIAERLVAARPVPRAAFRGDLRRRLLSGGSRATASPPSHLWARIGTAFASGCALLGAAATSI